MSGYHGGRVYDGGELARFVEEGCEERGGWSHHSSTSFILDRGVEEEDEGGGEVRKILRRRGRCSLSVDWPIVRLSRGTKWLD